jgi:hypothetical protein
MALVELCLYCNKIVDTTRESGTIFMMISLQHGAQPRQIAHVKCCERRHHYGYGFQIKLWS